MASSLAATMCMGMTITTVPTPSRVLLFQPNLITYKRRTITCSISNNHTNNNNNNNLSIDAVTTTPTMDILSGSTRTATTIFAAVALCIKAFGNILPPPDLCLSIGSSSSSLFFAAFMKRSSQGSLNTPLTVVAAGLKKWLDIYSGILFHPFSIPLILVHFLLLLYWVHSPISSPFLFRPTHTAQVWATEEHFLNDKALSSNILAGFRKAGS
ncbi:ylmG protein 1-2, chloroplastic [Trifolium repens]|nr:ylmG protein 1-2, chloroplastic [Trifolium repens]